MPAANELQPKKKYITKGSQFSEQTFKRQDLPLFLSAKRKGKKGLHNKEH